MKPPAPDETPKPSVAANDTRAAIPEPPGPPIVGIGASAGGLEALAELTKRLSAGSMAYVIVQHLAPGHATMLSEILARGTTLPVVTIEDGMRIEPSTIYVVPASGELSIADGLFHLEPVADFRRPRYSIDALLRTLAATRRSVIGVLLSGTGTDGTLGLRAIKEEGGITMVQEPSTAAQPGMPQSALDAGVVDFSLTPAEIADELMRLQTHPFTGKAPPARTIERDALQRIYARLRAVHGVDFSQYKMGTVERRIGRRMALHKIDKLDDYVVLLQRDGAELQNLYGDLLIGVTQFFRDAEAFEALKTTVFPHLLENRNPDAPIRVWVAGCASGEETYSIAIELLEFVGDRVGVPKIQVFATDIDEEALARARTAEYPRSVELDVSPERLRRFFTGTRDGYQVARSVRDLVVFARHNLGKDPPFSRLDLISCRNVLIYMRASLQRRVLRTFHYALNTGAFLLLGTSESVGDAAGLFSFVDRKLKVYVKQETLGAPLLDLGYGARAPDEPDEEMAPSAAAVPEFRPILNVAALADRKVIEKYAPPGVIVDEKLDVMQFRGRIGPFLEPAPGAATLNLLKLARPEMLVALRTLVNKVQSDNVPASSPPVPLGHVDEGRAVSIDVTPLVDGMGRKGLLVLFVEAPTVTRPPKPIVLAPGAPTAPADSRVAALERDLATIKEYLQATIEELEAANEELQSSNEELQSSNEELQSTNEELETSKEELQSTNEELATVNTELNDRMTQLSIFNDDLQNVLLNTAAAIVIVANDGRIRRFSAGAEKLLSLVPGDVGRPIEYLHNVMAVRDIDKLVAETISAVSPLEQRVRCRDGSWYVMTMAPYKTADHAIRGALIEFTKTSPPTATATAEEVPLLAQQVISALSQPVMLVDRRLDLVWANQAFFETFAIGPAMLGRPLSEAWGSTSEPSELWAFMQDVVAGKPVHDLVLERPFGRSGRPTRLSGRLAASQANRPGLAVVLFQEA